MRRTFSIKYSSETARCRQKTCAEIAFSQDVNNLANTNFMQAGILEKFASWRMNYPQKNSS